MLHSSADDAELTIGDVASLIQPRQQEWQLVSSEDEDNDEDDPSIWILYANTGFWFVQGKLDSNPLNATNHIFQYFFRHWDFAKGELDRSQGASKRW